MLKKTFRKKNGVSKHDVRCTESYFVGNYLLLRTDMNKIKQLTIYTIFPTSYTCTSAVASAVYVLYFLVEKVNWKFVFFFNRQYSYESISNRHLPQLKTDYRLVLIQKAIIHYILYIKVLIRCTRVCFIFKCPPRLK